MQKNKGHRSHSKAPYLGKVSLYWCKNCNVPLLTNIPCEICQQTGYQVPISPPGDVRPCFQGDRNILIETLDRQYGVGFGLNLIPNESLLLLNRTGGLDRTDEVIGNGDILGVLFFNPIKLKFEFHPTLFGAQKIVNIFQKTNKTMQKSIWIKDDAVPFILDGKSVLAPGVTKFTTDILDNDYVFILGNIENNEKCIAVGISRGNSQEFNKMIKDNYGQIAKNREHIETHTHTTNYLEKNSTLNDAYRANFSQIQEKVRLATKFIKEVNDEKKLPVAVAYSGGKDSLAVLLLVTRVFGKDFKIFFANTGLELPEVVENVHNIVKFLQMEDKLIIRDAGNKFWELVESFGPPGRDFRYCCHSLKAQQISDIIETIYNGNKVLVFLGQRQYESLNRSHQPRVYINTFIPKQVAASPIKSWNALLLWLFILNEKIPSPTGESLSVPINPLYSQGQERLGCYLCPASSIASLTQLEKTHPVLIKKWYEFLKSYAKKMQIPEEWVNFGLWRFKKYPPQWKEFIQNQNLDLQPKIMKNKEEIKLSVTKGYSPCVSGGYSIKAKINVPVDLDLISNLILALTKELEYEEDDGFLTVNASFEGKTYKLDLFADGSIFLQSNFEEFNYLGYLQNLMTIIYKSIKCTNCGVCVSICTAKALKIENSRPFIDKDICTRCRLCLSHCPLLKEVQSIMENSVP